jgi:hypothetical protein
VKRGRVAAERSRASRALQRKPADVKKLGRIERGAGKRWRDGLRQHYNDRRLDAAGIVRLLGLGGLTKHRLSPRESQAIRGLRFLMASKVLGGEAREQRSRGGNSSLHQSPQPLSFRRERRTRRNQLSPHRGIDLRLARLFAPAGVLASGTTLSASVRPSPACRRLALGARRPDGPCH